MGVTESKTTCRVGVIIPAFNEEGSVAAVVRDLRKGSSPYAELHEVLVVDNASTDSTALQAKEAGARVVYEAERGYGAACLRGIAALSEVDVVLFVDADGSDVAEEWGALLAPLQSNSADLVIGSRVLGVAEEGALQPHQKFGNVIATFLINCLFGTSLTDLGPFRAIRAEVLQAIAMDDRDYGWTIQMEVKALRQGYRIIEVPVVYRRRQAGVSKIAGTLKGSFLAGKKILTVVAREYGRSLWFRKGKHALLQEKV